MNLMEEILIRPAEENDIPVMCLLLKELFSIEADFAPNSHAQSKGLRLLLQARPQAEVFVAIHHGAVVGMSSVQLVISTAEGGPSAWVEDVVLEKSYRSQGIGRLLLLHINDWVRRRGAQRIQLLADVQNQSAIDFYKHLSWAPTQLMCMRRHL